MFHAHDVLGAPILNFLTSTKNITPLLLQEDKIKVPRIQRKAYTVQEHTAQFASMLLPQKSDLYVVHLHEHSVFVRPAVDPTRLYLLQAQWSGLRGLFPTNSTLYCIVYANKAKQLMMGIYDIILEGGVEIKEDILARHARIWALTHGKPMPSNIYLHWLGHENACVDLLMNKKQSLPFQANRILRLEGDVYTYVISPISTKS